VTHPFIIHPDDEGSAIADIYRRYKHLDEMLSRDSEPASFNARIIRDLWMAIKEDLGCKK